MLLPEGRTFEMSEELLEGAIDIHVHAGPHIFSSPRRVDPFQAATQARDAGMRAIVFMDVFEMSNGTSWLVNRALPDFQTFGGLIMNTVYGGMNPRSVKTALYYGDGAKFISFGAHSTYFQAEREGHIIDGDFVPLSKIYPKFKTEELDRCIRIPVEGDPGPELDEILQSDRRSPARLPEHGARFCAGGGTSGRLGRRVWHPTRSGRQLGDQDRHIGPAPGDGRKGRHHRIHAGGLHAYNANSQDPLLRGAGIYVPRRGYVWWTPGRSTSGR